MFPVGFEPTISAGERPKTNALDRAATGTGTAQMTREFQSTERLGICCTFHITCSRKILNTAIFWSITQRAVVITDVSEQSVGSLFKGQESTFLTIENGTDRLPRLVGKELPLVAS